MKCTQYEAYWDSYPDSAWDKPSKTLVACDGKGNGCVLYTAGPHVRYEMEEGGCGALLCDLGLDAAPRGLSVWEGVYLLSYEDSEYTDTTSPQGDFRPLTASEWSSVQSGVCPWDDGEWRVP